MRLIRVQLYPSIVFALAVLLGTPLSAAAQDWPDIFDPGQILTLNLTLSSQDWATI